MQITPLKADDVILRGDFQCDEVPYNLVYRVLDSDDARCWKSPDDAMLFVQTPGLNGWLWISPSLSAANRDRSIRALVERLKDDPPLPGISAEPETATAFAQVYAGDRGMRFRLHMALASYHCPSVIPSKSVSGGSARPAEEKDLRKVAAFFAGFAQEAHGASVDADSQLQAASAAIASGNLFVWESEGEVVSMANIAHRSPRHGRINAVYTPPDSRNRGFAGALVAELSAVLLREELTPMLYTDAANPISNRAYRNVGFIAAGSISDIKFEFEEGGDRL
ncbi:GNAT family N-acetyltransferase [Cohnella sp. GbtcB17]|uniref:GNAT family N-acetyltransferase n=1 Tax=Cohnella sp. GbtcB17 TaxID=2824762 RepID=UPI001C2F86EE|nr:GNAT family N-acetyltransferase [Cohnella sp. GbtcB17]